MRSHKCRKKNSKIIINIQEAGLGALAHDSYCLALIGAYFFETDKSCSLGPYIPKKMLKKNDGFAVKQGLRGAINRYIIQILARYTS